MTDISGSNFGGHAIVISVPRIAAPISSEFATLLPSPIYVTFTFAISFSLSNIVK